MADREIMELNGQPGGSGVDGSVETVTGAGRVGVIAAEFETRQRRVVIAGQAQGVPLLDPEDRPVSRTEAAEGMRDLELRAATAIAGTAAQSAQAVNVLAE